MALSFPPLYDVPQSYDGESGLVVSALVRLSKEALSLCPKDPIIRQWATVEGDIFKICHSEQLLYTVSGFSLTVLIVYHTLPKKSITIRLQKVTNWLQYFFLLLFCRNLNILFISYSVVMFTKCFYLFIKSS